MPNVIDRLLAHQGASDESIALILVVAAIWMIWVGQDRLRNKGFPRLPRAVAWIMVSGGAALVIGGPVIARTMFGPVEPADGPRPRSTARLAIISPQRGTVISGETFELNIRLDGAIIIEEANTDVRPDTGHLHVTIDDRLLSMTGDLQQELDSSGLTDGQHTLTVEFVAADHGPFSPRVAVGVDFTVEGP